MVPDELQVARSAVVGPSGPRGPLTRGLGGAVARAGALLRRDSVVILGLVILAAAVRFAGFPARGDFDGDQGHDMLTLLRLVRDGQLPLLGPPTSIGDFHHGAAYYYLLAPAALLSGVNPSAVIAWIGLLGVAGVIATWWFARMIGGPVVGALAGLLLAVSPGAIEESIFIWNPNPIPLFAALALGCAWRGHVSGRRRWTVAAIASAGMVMQLHVLGITLLPIVLAWPVADAIRALRAGDRAAARHAAGSIGIGLAIVAVLYVPLLVSELQTGFEETRHLLDYVRGGASGAGDLDPVASLAFTFLRIVGWPLVGLVSSTPAAAIIVVSASLVLVTWLALAGRGAERTAARWLGAGVLWSVLALSLLAPSLQAVVPGLPNDHYHAFADPIVVVAVALAARALGAGMGLEARVDVAARAVVSLAMVGLVALDVGQWPPLTHAAGGWPVMRDAGARVVALDPGATFDVRGLPIFKTAEGLGYPIVAAGASVAAIATDVDTSALPLVEGQDLVIACDRLFERVIGDACGGPAEDRYVTRLAAEAGSGTGTAVRPVLLDRFVASTRTVVSVYRIEAPPSR